MRKPKGHWPKTAPELAREGYQSDKKWKDCTCGARIFWVTTPSGARMPMEEVESGGRSRLFQSHFASCKDAAKHRRK